MSVTPSTITLSMPKLISTITLRVRFVRVAGARLWLAAHVIRLAGVIAGCDVEIDTGEPSKPLWAGYDAGRPGGDLS